MQIKLIPEKKAILVKTDAEMDHHIVSDMRRKIDTKIKSSNAVNVIFDFSELDFMDSSGIGMIMGRYKLTRILGGKIVVFGIKKQVVRIMEMSGINKLITVCETEDEAVKKI